MTDRAKLIEEYKKTQKVLVETEERLKSKILEREKVKDEYEKTEKYLNNLNCVAQLVGEVI